MTHWHSIFHFSQGEKSYVSHGTARILYPQQQHFKTILISVSLDDLDYHLTRGNFFPKLRLKLLSDLPWSSMGVLSSLQWGTVFVQDFTYSSQQLFYTCTSPGRERTETLVFVNSCIWSHAFISNWTLCFCVGISSLFPPHLAERTDGVYASIIVNEKDGITSSQDYRVLYDYTAQVRKGFQINTS